MLKHEARPELTIPSDIFAKAHSYPVAIAQLSPAAANLLIETVPKRSHRRLLRIAVLNGGSRTRETLDLNPCASGVLPNGSAGCPRASPVSKAVSDDPASNISCVHIDRVGMVCGLNILRESHGGQQSGSCKCQELHLDGVTPTGLDSFEDEVPKEGSHESLFIPNRHWII